MGLFHKHKKDAKIPSSGRLLLMETQKNTDLLLHRLCFQFLLFYPASVLTKHVNAIQMLINTLHSKNQRQEIQAR